MQNVPADVKAKVEAKINQCRDVLKAKYGQHFNMPYIKYDLKGTTAGTANYTIWTIRLNPVLLMENLTDFIARTVPHEMAHLACDQIYPECHRPGLSSFGYGRAKREVHGPRWQSIMRVLGADPFRCHSYDVSNARVKRGAHYTYVCSKCSTKLQLTTAKHNKIQMFAKAIYHKGCYGHNLVLETATKQVPVATLLPTKQAVKVPTGDTKIAKCWKLFENYPGYTREEMINVFVQTAGCTPAGAITYYNTCRKIHG